MTIASKLNEPRQIVPRWRPSSEAGWAVETWSSGSRPQSLPTDELEFDVHQWGKSKSDEDALEVLFGSMVLGSDVTVGNEIIKQLVDSQRQLQPMIRAAALARLMGVSGKSELTTARDLDEQLADKKEKFRRIRILKTRLRLAPRDPLAWADYARLAASLGAKSRAEQLMRVSKALAPENRYIARCAVRLLVHTDKAPEAKYLLGKMDRTKHDPWLLAADLAVSSIIGRSSKFLKLARDMAERADKNDPNFSELFGALSTHFYEGGSVKLARRYLHRALLNPTDNSLAQAEWIASKIGGVVIPDIAYNLPSSFEAKVRHYWQLQDWDGAINISKAWCDDEPFSPRPPVNASYLSAVALGKPSLCQKFCELGLIANPNDGTLLNNLAVAFALQGKANNAKEILDKHLKHVYKPDDIYILGLEALLAYRSGDTVKGRGLYGKAFEIACGKKSSVLAALALLYQIQEELVAATPTAVELFITCEPVIMKVKEPEIQLMLDRLRTQVRFLSQLAAKDRRTPSNSAVTHTEMEVL